LTYATQANPATITEAADRSGIGNALRDPSADGLDIAELSRLEVEHRRSIWKRVENIRQTSGADQVFLLQTAPQIGVRITRLLAGAHKMTAAEARSGKRPADTIAVGGTSGGWHLWGGRE